MAAHIENESLGLRMDESKALELTQKAADLGHPRANGYMGNHYFHGAFGFVKNESQAKLHWEVAAKKGDLISRVKLASLELCNENVDVALRHLRIAARSGHRDAISRLKYLSTVGVINEKELKASEKACDEALEEMRSEERDKFIQYLKDDGQYHGDISDCYTKDA